MLMALMWDAVRFHPSSVSPAAPAPHHPHGFDPQEVVDLFLQAGLINVEVRRVHEVQRPDGERFLSFWLFMVLGHLPAPTEQADKKSMSKFGRGSYTAMS